MLEQELAECDAPPTPELEATWCKSHASDAQCGGASSGCTLSAPSRGFSGLAGAALIVAGLLFRRARARTRAEPDSSRLGRELDRSRALATKTRTVARMAARALLLALVLGGGISACSSDEKRTLDASDYDQTCSVDSDCVIIDIGACECSCSTAVINAKDQAKFQHDLEQCDTGGNECGMCLWMGSSVPYCNGGQCDSKAKGDAG
ncbi:MAG: hypothetical protein IT377_12405 [Polyangiaceae bacterium]|nr:hypothetical protein [Polyangiaceae bacterium]